MVALPLWTALLSAGSLAASALQLLPPLPEPTGLTRGSPWRAETTQRKIYIEDAFASRSDTDGLTLIPPTAYEFAEVFRQDISELTGANWTLERVGRLPDPADVSGILLGAFTGDGQQYPTYENGQNTSEGYELRVSVTSVFIGGAGARGMWWGTRTLLQLILVSTTATEPPAQLTAGYQTVDAPAYATRGFMLDAGRKWYAPSFLKELCSYASFFKLSEFHYHLSDNYPLNRGRNDSWTDVYSHFSLLPERDSELRRITHGRENETLSRAEFTDLQLHCARRGITVIPEIEAPGHCLYLTKWRPEISLPRKRDLLNLTHPDAVPTVKRVWAEFLPWFRTKEVHIGADEYDSTLADDYIPFVNEMATWVREQTGNKTRIRVWGTHAPPSAQNLTISRDVVVQHWQYGESDPIALLQNGGGGHDVINSEDWWAYTSIKNDHMPILPARYPQFFNEARVLNFAGRDGWQWTPADFNPFNASMQVSPSTKGLRGATLAAWNDNGPDASTQLEAYYSIRRGIPLVGARAWSGFRGPRLDAGLVAPSIDSFSPLAPGQNLDRVVVNRTRRSGDDAPLVSWSRADDGRGAVRLGLGSKGMNYTLTLEATGPFRLSGPDCSLSLVARNASSSSLSSSSSGLSLVFEADGWQYPLRSVGRSNALELDPGHPGRIWVNASGSTHKEVGIQMVVPASNITVATDALHGSMVWVDGNLAGRFEVFVYGGRNTQFSWSQMAFVAPLDEVEGGLRRLRLEEGFRVPGGGGRPTGTNPPPGSSTASRAVDGFCWAVVWVVCSLVFFVV
ncbi:glycoside hydrolase [Magnaporthiopsis poae ATCC 64411]|uniref:beta-N-acetylhexosaminidase n=1 Tax=Magnaporthiopsis poae (strain ATCC 64411 / 73-15) TaxID=644358 RepID=A0A0C4E9I3_MAGP6|nr:glycoside hydrolase [Magnaporthiopsis poae ATCC 64411]